MQRRRHMNDHVPEPLLEENEVGLGLQEALDGRQTLRDILAAVEEEGLPTYEEFLGVRGEGGD